MKKVSIIIPVYNQEELVIRCLNSIPKRNDIEIIVINDGSTDNTKKVLNEYKKHYSKLKIISYDKNNGVSYARNKGIDKAIGEYILFIDSDDYINSDVFNDIVDNDLGFVDIVFYDMIDKAKNVYFVDNHRVMNRVGAFKFVKRSFIGDTRFRLNVQYGEDAIFHESLMLKSPTLLCTRKIMYNYNYPREGSLTYLYQNHRSSKDDIKNND